MPTDAYLAGTDGTLKKTAFIRTATHDGFIDTGAPRSTERSNIFVLGGSFVESLFALPEERFVARAAHRLDANILNGGYSGMTSLQLALVVLAKIAGIAKPGDAVVAFTPKSDTGAMWHPGGFWTGNKTYTPVLPGTPNDRPARSTDYLATVRAIHTFTATIGLHLSLATSPHRATDYTVDTWMHKKVNYVRYHELARLQRKIDARTRAAAKDLGVPLLDLQTLCDGNPDLFYDDYHLNDHGQRVVGDLFTEFLEKDVMPNLGKPVVVTRSALTTKLVDALPPDDGVPQRKLVRLRRSIRRVIRRPNS